MTRARWRSAPWVIAMTLLCGASASAHVPSGADSMAEPPEPRPVFALSIGQPRAPGMAELRAVHSDVAMMHAFFGALAPRHRYVHLPPSDVRTDLAGDGTTVGAPTWAEIEASVDAIEAAVDALDGRADVYVYYAGHGRKRRVGSHTRTDLFLEPRVPSSDAPGHDGILTTRLLQQHLLARLDGEETRVHLIVDACQSAFLLESRGLRRTHRVFKAPPQIEARMLTDFIGRYASVGALLATSGSQVTYESVASGGVFSYAVRSAAIGAADLDGDGRITYGELKRVLPSILSKRPGGGVPRLLAPGGRDDEAFVDYRRRGAAAVTFAPPRATRYELQSSLHEPYAALYPDGDDPAVVFLPRDAKFLALAEVPRSGPRVWYRFQAMSRGFDALQERYTRPTEMARASEDEPPHLVLHSPLSTETLVPVGDPPWVWNPEHYTTLALALTTEAAVSGRTVAVSETRWAAGGEVNGAYGRGVHQLTWRMGYSHMASSEYHDLDPRMLEKNPELLKTSKVVERRGHLPRLALGYQLVLAEFPLAELSAGVFAGTGLLMEQRKNDDAEFEGIDEVTWMLEGGADLTARLLIPDTRAAIRIDLRASAQGFFYPLAPWADFTAGATVGYEYEFALND